MAAIFISHSSKDNEIADKIKRWLGDQGYERVFLDFDDDQGIAWGEDWESRLYEELKRCHAVLLLLTPHWLDSKWCVIELAQARTLGKIILPILCAPISGHKILPQIQAGGLLDWNEAGLAKLKSTLESITSELARGFKFDSSRPPFPGIHSFEEGDAAIYFGRDQDINTIVEKLEGRRTKGGEPLFILMGASGAGKSSLLKAGVLPQIRRRKDRWIVLPLMRPEKTPLEDLSKSIAAYLQQPDKWRDWKAKLCGEDAVEHVGELLKDLRTGDARSATLLLPIDQFEEIFTVSEPKEREGFINLLAAVLDRKKMLHIMVIATGRSDLLESLLGTTNLTGTYETYPLAPMALGNVESLIRGPASLVAFNVEERLPRRIEQDVESMDALPLLALTLSSLYQLSVKSSRKTLTVADYVSLGDPVEGLNPIHNAVRRVANEAIARAKPTAEELAALRDAFVPHLVRVRLEDGRRVRQSAFRSELPREALPLINELRDAHLLSERAVVADGKAHTVVEVTHEALFKAWQLLDQWLTEDVAFLSDIERIKSAFNEWAQLPEDQPVDMSEQRLPFRSRLWPTARLRPNKGKMAGALLQGFLLTRARDWINRYPRRFQGPAMVELRNYITLSAQAEDAERKREAKRLRRQLIIASIAAAAFAGIAIFAVVSWRLAQSNLYAARSAISTLVEATSDTVQPIAQLDQVQGLIDQMQTTMKDLAANTKDPDILLQNARTLLIRAEIDWDRGETDRMWQDASGALDALVPLASAGNLEARHERDRANRLIGLAYWEENKNDDAANEYQKGIDDLALMLHDHPDDPNLWRWQLSLADLNQELGDVLLFRQGKVAQAQAAFEACRSGRIKVRDSGHTGHGIDADIAWTENKFGDVQWRLGHLDDAMKRFEAAVDGFEKLGDQLWEDIPRAHRRGLAYNNLGLVHRRRGEFKEGEEAFKKAENWLKDVVKRDPKNRFRRSGLYWTEDNRGEELIWLALAEKNAGLLDEAHEILSAAQEGMRVLALEAPNKYNFKMSLIDMRASADAYEAAAKEINGEHLQAADGFDRAAARILKGYPDLWAPAALRSIDFLAAAGSEYGEAGKIDRGEAELQAAHDLLLAQHAQILGDLYSGEANGLQEKQDALRAKRTGSVP